MKLVIAICTLALSGVAVASDPQIKKPECGGGLLALKTWSDPQRFQVKTNTNNISIHIANRVRSPFLQPHKRISTWQKNIWKVKAQIVEYRITDGAIRMVLYLDDMYMNAVLPAPICLNAKTRQRTQIEGTWRTFVEHCGTPSRREYLPLGAVVHISGIGFWANKRILRRGMAPNGAELTPVTRIRYIAGCGT